MLLDRDRIQWEWVTITPDKARELLAINHKENRTVSKSHVKQLAEAFKNGEFYIGTPLTKVFQEDVDKEFLVNGQHTLNAIIDAGVTVDLRVDLVMTHNDMETTLVYSSFDTPFVRSSADSIRRLLVSQGVIKAKDPFWSNHRVQRLTSSVAYIGLGFPDRRSGAKISIFDLYLPVRQYVDATRIYFELAGGCSTKMNDRARLKVMFALGLATLTSSAKEYGLEKVKDFWYKVFHGASIKDGDPTRQAFMYLIGEKTQKKKVDPTKITMSTRDNQLKRLIAHCFNQSMLNKHFSHMPGYVWEGNPKPAPGEPFTRNWEIKGFDFDNPFAGLDGLTEIRLKVSDAFED